MGWFDGMGDLRKRVDAERGGSEWRPEEEEERGLFVRSRARNGRGVFGVLEHAAPTQTEDDPTTSQTQREQTSGRHSAGVGDDRPAALILATLSRSARVHVRIPLNNTTKSLSLPDRCPSSSTKHMGYNILTSCPTCPSLHPPVRPLDRLPRRIPYQAIEASQAVRPVHWMLQCSAAHHHKKSRT